MPRIMPFRGVVYNKKKVGRLERVVAPPYDVIPPKQQDRLYRASPYNIVRLELGKMTPKDSGRDNRYTRARKAFEAWLKDGVMVRDEREALYVYSQRYAFGGRTIERIGFIGLMGLDEGKGAKVLPHENTLMAPKIDRLDLIRSVKANLSPIYVLYDDAGGRIARVIGSCSARQRPFMDVRFEGIRNRVWRLDDPKAIRLIERLMSKKDIFIADGHHRYEVSKMYRSELAGRAGPGGPASAAGRLMVYFVASDEKMLTVLPAHRLLKDIGSLAKERIPAALSGHFGIRRVPGLKAMMAGLGRSKDAHAFGMYLGSGRFYLLVLKDAGASDAAIEDKPKDWKRLDVVILHRFIFQHLLGAKDSDENVGFVKSPEETASLIDKGAFKAAFFLNPTKVSEIKRIAKLGEKMPRKATYFYPKPISGVVINPLGELRA